MDTVMHILEAIGVGAAAGLSSLAALAAVALLAAIHLGLDPRGSDADYLADAAIAIIASAMIVQALIGAFTRFGLRTRIAADQPRGPLHLMVSVAFGGIGGWFVWSAEHETPVAGALIGAVSAALVAPALATLLSGVRDRLAAREQRTPEAESGADDNASSLGVLAAGTDIAAIAAVAAALLLPPLGIALPLLAVFLLVGSRRKAEQKHEGLRVLR